jgi:hypothetical protein
LICLPLGLIPERAAVKHQYVGDVNDYRKYALLRALAAGGANRIGVCWMLTPDGGTDGGKLGYLEKPEQYRDFDPELFDLLSRASAEPDWRRLDTVEENGAIPSATYFNEELPAGVEPRRAFMEHAREAFAACDLVFFDPDNGLSIKTVTKAQKEATKFLFPDEVAAFYGAGKSVLIYQHFPRMGRDVFVAACAARLHELAPDAALWAFRTAHVVFLLMLHPESPASLLAAVEAASRRWSVGFIRGYPITLAQVDPLAQLLAELESDTTAGRG